MRARILFPHGNYSGNLLWNTEEAREFYTQITQSVVDVRARHYFASAFPEGDGVTFRPLDGHPKTNDQMLTDVRESFPWLEIEVGKTGDSNFELADLEADREIECIISVPLDKVKIENSFALGRYEFRCPLEEDTDLDTRYADIRSEYLSFTTVFPYSEILRVNRSFEENDVLILKCLSLAEHAMDLIRYDFSSFLVPQLTPNPAGQLQDGFYEIEIFPLGETHIEPFTLKQISRHMSVSNNWLGPDLEGGPSDMAVHLLDWMDNHVDEMSLSVRAALRGVRQSFYTVGDESKFLNLVFTLDGLTAPESGWMGWTHRTYIAALVSEGKPVLFKAVLEDFNSLYGNVRNRLVHGGVDFYQLDVDPLACCDQLNGYIRDVIEVVVKQNIKTINDLHNYAKAHLGTQAFKDAWNEVIPPTVPNSKRPNW